MASSQQHGFAIEAALIAQFDRCLARRGPSAIQATPSYTARFDVGAHRDPYGSGTPSSIKSSKYTGPNTLVCLSDAVRITKLTEVPKMRLLVALYRQKADQKEVFQIREYLVTGEEWSRLIGTVPVDQIEAFSTAIKHPVTSTARATARAWRDAIRRDHPSAIRWNAKIDSKNQRRLQCSVRLADLEATITEKSRIRVFGLPTPTPALAEQVPAYLRPASRHLWGRGGLSLPLCVASPPRHRHPKPVAGSTVDLDPVSPVPLGSPSTKRMRCA